jgi:hypothetical protein
LNDAKINSSSKRNKEVFLEDQSHWFEESSISGKLVAIHWKGRVFETLPIVFSALWVATTIARFIPTMHVSDASAFFTFAFFAFAQAAKYYFYHEKSR